MLADSIADEPARTEGGQETAGSSRSTIILKPVPIVQPLSFDFASLLSGQALRSSRSKPFGGSTFKVQTFKTIKTVTSHKTLRLCVSVCLRSCSPDFQSLGFRNPITPDRH
jgi:hypothetical protein